jgi:hypothetical protein
MRLTMTVNTTGLRALADEPAANGFVPVHPDTLRDVADQIDRLRTAVRNMLDAPGYALDEWSGGSDPDSWRCNLCGEEWETQRHDPAAHAEDCPMREVYAALSQNPS